MKIGIIGAGAIGSTLARVAVRCGHEVTISNSTGMGTLLEVAQAASCKAGTTTEVTHFSDILILAIPFKAIWQLEPQAFAGKIVLDANNYYPARDGVVVALEQHETTTSCMLQTHLGSSARVIKFFNAIMQRDIESDARPEGVSPRRALPIAGNDAEAKKMAADLVNQFGFDPIDAGTLEESWRFERAMPSYCIALVAAEMAAALASAQRGVELPHGSWQKSRGFIQAYG
jgi:predicted dinucleotide-binding enzyme